MTTEGRAFVWTLGTALGAWAVILAGVTALRPDRALMVIAPPPGLITRLPEARLVDAGRVSLTLTGVTAGDVISAGGWFILPARRGGCLSLQRSVTRAAAD